MFKFLPPAAEKRRKLFYYSAALALVLLVGVGIFARNGWFPSTDPLSGKRTGWFGQPLAKNAPSSWNPLAVDPTPTPVALSKEYIYAGSRLLAIEDANANAAPPADLAIWRPSTGVWWILNGSGQYSAFQWGSGGDPNANPPIASDIPVPGDFDGDGKTDLSVFRPSTASQWWISKSSDGSSFVVNLGDFNGGDIPAPADYDGDGRTDVAIWRPSTSVWYIVKSSDATTIYPTFGLSGDKPAPADFDGDGKADLAVWRGGSTRIFYSQNSSNNQVQYPPPFEQGSTQPVPADYDGDGKADYAIRDSATNNWVIRKSSTGTYESVSWYSSSDIAVQNDYDGDGKVDIAVWRPAESSQGAGDTGTWFIRQSGTNNSLRQQQWGTAGDKPVPAYYRR